ncbi:putative sperm motility kinase W [Sycon ciliatum]|uniref:putative sperm motility kinase W n=1 Tax=Sycon ciliatum TaxID=27933 RepID=UPI0031F6C5FF
MEQPWPVRIPKIVFGDPVEYDPILRSVDKRIMLQPNALGAGKFGRVLPAMIPSCKSVAAKILFYKDRQHYNQYICREVLIGLRLHHPNIAECFGAVQTDLWPVIFHEQVPGGSLLQVDEELDVEKCPIAEVHLRTIFSQVLSGLHYLQTANVVHGDLHDGNIMVSGEGSVKIIDFGYARDISNGKLKLVRTHRCPFPPEVLVADYGGIDHKLDIFLLGRTIYHTAVRSTGFKNFANRTPEEQCQVIANGVDQAPRRYAKLSSELRDFINLLVSYAASDRPDAAMALHHPWFTNDPDYQCPVLRAYQKRPNPSGVEDLNSAVLQAMVEELGDISFNELADKIIHNKNSWQAIAYRANLFRHGSPTPEGSAAKSKASAATR